MTASLMFFSNIDFILGTFIYSIWILIICSLTNLTDLFFGRLGIG